MPDRIEIRGLRALGLIGVNPEERERTQPFEVDFVSPFASVRSSEFPVAPTSS